MRERSKGGSEVSSEGDEVGLPLHLSMKVVETEVLLNRITFSGGFFPRVVG